MSIERSDRLPVDSGFLEGKAKEYEARFPKAFAVLHAGGVHPTQKVTLKNVYKPGHPEDNEDFCNVGRHCVAVAYACERFATAAGIPADDIVSRGLVHDANKRLEVMRKKAKGVAGLESSDDVYTGEAYEAVQDALRGHIDPDLLAYIARAGKETGHQSVADFIELDQHGRVALRTDRTDAEKIVHLADDSTHTPLPTDPDQNTYFVTPAERMAMGNFPTRYPFLYKEGFGFDADGKPVHIKDVATTTGLREVRTYADWQVIVSNLIAGELQARISPGSKQDAAAFMADIANG